MKQKQKKTMKPRKLWSYVWRLWLVCIPVCTAMILDNIAITKRNFQENFLRNDITSSQLFNQSLWCGALSYYFVPTIVPAIVTFEDTSGNDMLEFFLGDSVENTSDNMISKMNGILMSYILNWNLKGYSSPACGLALDAVMQEDETGYSETQNLFFLTSEEKCIASIHDESSNKYTKYFCTTDIPQAWLEQTTGNIIINKLWNDDTNNSDIILMKTNDVYVKGSECRLGSYQLVRKYDNDTEEVLDTAVDVEGELEGYTHLHSPANVYFMGTQKGADTIQMLDNIKVNAKEYGCTFADAVANEPVCSCLQNYLYHVVNKEYYLIESQKEKLLSALCDEEQKKFCEQENVKFYISLISVAEKDETGLWETERLPINTLPFVGRLFPNLEPDTVTIPFIVIISVDLVLTAMFLAFLAAIWLYLRYQKRYRLYTEAEYRRTLTNTLAHDLKTPLTAIRGYTENLIENTNPEKNDYYLEKILENTIYTNQMIQDVLQLAKIEEKSEKVPMERIDFAEILRETLMQNEEALTMRGMTLKLTDEPFMFVGNAAMLKQMAVNLADNVRNYAADGATVTMEVQKKKLILRNDCNDADKLCGKDLMQPFAKGDSSRSGQNGSGLGLAIVKELAKQQELEVEAAIKENAFWFMIEA